MESANSTAVSQHLFTTLYYLFLFYPLCWCWLHHLHNLLKQAVCVCKGFWCVHSSTHSLARKTVIYCAAEEMAAPTYGTSFTVSQDVAGACVMSKMRYGLLRTLCCRKKDKKFSVSSCTFQSLYTCIIQFNIFPFYDSKYSWMIKAQGELAQKLANL